MNPSYTAVAGDLTMNDAGSALRKRYEAIKKQVATLDAAYCAAVLAGALLERPWLLGFKVEIAPSAEYNDEGGTYRSMNLSVSDLQFGDRSSMDPELISEGEVLEDTVTSELEDWLTDADWDLHGIFEPDYSYDPVTIDVTRAAIEDLITEGAVDGRAAVARFFPSRAAHLLGNKEATEVHESTCEAA